MCALSLTRVGHTPRASSSAEHRNPDWHKDLWVMFVTGCLTFAVAFLVLRYRHADKQR